MFAIDDQRLTSPSEGPGEPDVLKPRIRVRLPERALQPFGVVSSSIGCSAHWRAGTLARALPYCPRPTEARAWGAFVRTRIRLEVRPPDACRFCLSHCACAGTACQYSARTRPQFPRTHVLQTSMQTILRTRHNISPLYESREIGQRRNRAAFQCYSNVLLIRRDSRTARA